MRAVVLHQHGAPSELTLETDYPMPDCGDDDVVVRVRAASLNYHDIFTCRGMPGITLPLPVVPGLDFAGEIETVGGTVTGWAAGDRVLVDPVNRVAGGLMGETVDGGFQEFCRVPAHQLIALPDNLSFAEAAALPVAYGSAHRMIMTHGRLKAGESVLVLGASGGVGVACVQLAKLAGAKITACTSSDAKGEQLRALGADHIVNYAEQDLVKGAWGVAGKPKRHSRELGYDMVVNFTGGDTWAKSLKCLKPGGRMVTNGATAGYDPQTDIRYIFGLELEIRGSTGFKPEDIARLLELSASGKLKPLIDREFQLEDFAQAFELLENRTVVGKTILAP